MRLKNLMLLIAVLTLSTACDFAHAQATKSPPSVQSTEERQIAAGIIPCDTDLDCETKNPEAKPLCEAYSQSGKACTRHVSEAGLLCWQHSRMMNRDPKQFTADQAMLKNGMKPKARATVKQPVTLRG